MLKIRLQRTGKRGQAYFRLIVTEHTTKPKGKYLELLGTYDPHNDSIQADGERVKHWLSKGAQISATANNLLVGHNLIQGQKVQIWKPKAKAKSSEPEVKKVTPTQVTEKPSVNTDVESGEAEKKILEESPAETQASP